MTRSDLHQLVWAHPVRHLAPQLGLSETELRRLCNDCEVPLPKPGYWSKRAHNKAPAPDELPTLVPNVGSAATGALRHPDGPKVARDISVTEQTDSRATLDPLAERLRVQLRSCEPDQYGFVTSASRNLPYVDIAATSIDRVTVLFDSLVRTLRSSGYQFVETASGLRIKADEELFSVRFREARGESISATAAKSSGGGKVASTPVVERRRRSAKRLKPSDGIRMEIVDTRSFRWGKSNIVGRWQDHRHRSVDQFARLAVRALKTTAPMISVAREKRRLQALQTKSELLKTPERKTQNRELQFMLGKAESLGRLQNLSALAELLRSNASIEKNQPVERMIASLHNLITEVREKFGREALNAELAALDLFSERM